MKEYIILKNKNPVGRGSEHIVYFHPEDNSKLIKVINSDHINFMKTKKPLIYLAKRLKRYGGFSNIVTEHLVSREEDIVKKYHIQSFVGFVDTDMGLGIVVNAIRNIDGSIAYSIGNIIKKGIFGYSHQKALNDLLNWVSNVNIILRDPGLNNLVWDEKNEHFVIIDGIGSRSLLSLRHHCKWYNLRSNRKRAKKIRSRVEKCIIENNIKIS